MRRVDLKFAIPVALLVLAGLAVAKEIFQVPKPLITFIGGMFGVCSLVFWSLQRKRNTGIFVRLAAWLLIWGIVTTAALDGVYYFDKGGWMWFKLSGYNITLAENLQDQVNVAPAAFVARYPFFSFDPQDSTQLLIEHGAYEVDETIVVPPGLTLAIAPGTELRFGVGASLISYSSIIARGTPETPIIFTAQHKWRKWGVVGVVRAGQSVFEHVRFEHGRQALVNAIDFPGALSLVDTEAEVTQCYFKNLVGKDGAQVHHGRVFFRNNTFQDCFKDGIDFDGGAGEISHNRFAYCGDEAIDLGEDSRVQVFGNVIIGSKDAPKGDDGKLSKATANIVN
jgi:hypothetical protein